MIYLDHNASTPVDPDVADVMLSAVRSNYGNPSSLHAMGTRARTSMEKARSQIAELVGVLPEEIFFTSGGTESNNLAVIGSALNKGRGHIITSRIEHPSVLNPCSYLETKGFAVTYVGVDGHGRVSVDEVKKALRTDTIFISMMHANNETGVLQPVEEVGILARERGIIFHTDAAQTLGKISLQADSLRVDMMTIVPHKFYGPKGVGALYLRKGLSLHPLLWGAGHERGLRPGTENVPGIAGFGKACELARHFVARRMAHTHTITDMLYQGLKEKIAGIRLNGHETLRLPNTLNISVTGIDSIDLLEKIKDTVAGSPGSACHSGQKNPSPVLKAMGLSDNEALSSVRLSTGKDNTEKEMREAIEILASAVHTLHQKKPG
ncbi:MAG: cysteine desulfurase family protein [Thermodesulfovibrionales bacterium]|jgi:cysteine desulfurase